jgi:hypothetical protein
MVPPDPRRMIPRSSATRRCAQTATEHELRQSRELCWRMTHELEALRDTIAVLRAGANALALDNATLKIDNEHLRARVRTPPSKHVR